MPTIFPHIAIPVAARLGAGSQIPLSMLLTGMLCTVLPDFDGISFKLGIAYGSILGHRGVTHTALFAVCIGMLGLYLSKRWQIKSWQGFAWLFCCTVSHPLLDMLTNGGHGIPFFWPLTSERYFLPWRPIEVSPIALSRFFSERGAAVLLNEMKVIWLPCLACAAVVAGVRKWRK
jgi:inner membrane protein